MLQTLHIVIEFDSLLLIFYSTHNFLNHQVTFCRNTFTLTLAKIVCEIATVSCNSVYINTLILPRSETILISDIFSLLPSMAGVYDSAVQIFKISNRIE